MIGLTKITPFCGNKRTFLQTPSSTGLLSTPITTKNKTAYVHFYRVSQSAYWWARHTIRQWFAAKFSKANNLTCPYPATIKKKKEKKKKIVYLFRLFCLVNNFMIWKRKKKERKKKETFNGGVRIRTRNLWITKLAPYHWGTETNFNLGCYKIMYLYSIWRLGPYDLRPVQSHKSNFD